MPSCNVVVGRKWTISGSNSYPVLGYAAQIGTVSRCSLPAIGAARGPCGYQGLTRRPIASLPRVRGQMGYSAANRHVHNELCSRTHRHVPNRHVPTSVAILTCCRGFSRDTGATREQL